MNHEQLKEIVNLHRLWITDEGGQKADLKWADLRGADLSGANLSDANLSDANLRGADLIRANLIRANLSDANLSDANLRGADLIRANLSDADLKWADLIRANLTGADLIRANLSDADLRRAIGDGDFIKSLQCGTYLITYTASYLCIGCEEHTFDEWYGFTDERIHEMDEKALEWWRVWKPIIQTIVSASPAKITNP